MPPKRTEVEALRHDRAKRLNNPTAELESLVPADMKRPIRMEYDRFPLRKEREGRDADLDPQLVWRGKDQQDWSDLVVQAPPLYVQEKVHPKVLIDDLLRQSRARANEAADTGPDLFADFNGLPDPEAAGEFYAHDQHWSNRMILGDSLRAMASLAERDGLRGKVQCIYIDPPYGISFNSNFQWSTRTTKVDDKKRGHATREPEQVKAFRDTWRDGIHSYLSYLRDRLTVAGELLSETGSVFVQISYENSHRVRAVLDEIFGSQNFISEIRFKRGGFQTSDFLPETFDLIIWYAKDKNSAKFRRIYLTAERQEAFPGQTLYAEDTDGAYCTIKRTEVESSNKRIFRHRATYSATGTEGSRFPYLFEGREFLPSGQRGWSTSAAGMVRAHRAGRLLAIGNTLERKMYFEDFPCQYVTSDWGDTVSSGFGDEKIYVVQTQTVAVQRCILMVTDPGDLVLDPTCGSGTTAYVAEQWGRRWVTIDTSRVALALARARIMGAKYPHYLLADSKEGQQKEAEVTRTPPKQVATYGDVSHGFVYERVPHITLKSIANNAEIDVIWDKYQAILEPLRGALNTELRKNWEEWEIPRQTSETWPDEAKATHREWWVARLARQKEIDASIAAKAEHEYLYDKPYEDKSKVRVAGPFTVESLMPYRYVSGDAEEMIDILDAAEGTRAPRIEMLTSVPDEDANFVTMVLEHLRVAGVQQAHKEGRITFTSLLPWAGTEVDGQGRPISSLVAQGRYMEGETERRAGIFIGPEFGTVSRPDLVDAARQAAEAGFDILIACAFNYDARSSEFSKLGKLPVLQARMNPDLHMSGELKNTGSGNMFVVFGEPDIELTRLPGNQLQVTIRGMDIFDPRSNEVKPFDASDITVWFLDTDYNEESFFVRQAYFPGMTSDPYQALKRTLKAEIDEEAWESLRSDTSRPFPVPATGRIAVKVINHLGDEVMKVIRV